MSYLLFLAINFLAAHVWWFVGAFMLLAILGAACAAGSDEDDAFGMDNMHGDVPHIPPEYGEKDAA